MGIGPSTKETSLHHFRDPLLDVVSKDTDVDLMGVMLVGSPDGNEDKMLVGTKGSGERKGAAEMNPKLQEAYAFLNELALGLEQRP